MRKKLFLHIACLALSFPITAQFSEEYNKYKKMYPDVDKVRLVDETSVYITMDNDDININVDYNVEDLFLKSKANFYSENSISYSSFFEVSNVAASSFIYRNDKYKETKVTDFKHKDELDGNVFYDDHRTINFIYPNLEEGCKTKLTYSEAVMNPRFLGSFYFGDFIPVIKAVYTISVDKRIQLDFKQFNVEGMNIVFTKTEKGKNIIYRWETENIARYESESNTTNYRNTIAHIIPIITSYSTSTGKKDLLDDVGGLYNWYYDLVKDVNTEKPSAELVQTVHDLTDDMESDMEKVRAIYYWAQQNIKYVAFEYALGGFIPRNANEIYSKKYGDCKDNSSLMAEMLEIAGIEGHLTWIGTRDIPYSYLEVPAPVSDNHMILTYIRDTSCYFLDATGRFLPMEMPSSFIQGKEALISLDSANYLIRKVPVVPAVNNRICDTISIDIQEDDVIGKGTAIMSGYVKQDFFFALERQKTKEDATELYKLNLTKGNNKFVISEYHETNKFDYDKDFIVDYSFSVNDYVQQTDEELFINMNLSKRASRYRVKKDDVLDKEYDFKNAYNLTETLNIPSGYEVEYLPSDFELKNEKYAARISYTVKDHTIIYQYDFVIDMLILPSDEISSFNNFIDKLEKEFKESVVLKKSKP